jgi:hypothetical protein
VTRDRRFMGRLGSLWIRDWRCDDGEKLGTREEAYIRSGVMEILQDIMQLDVVISPFSARVDSPSYSPFISLECVHLFLSIPLSLICTAIISSISITLFYPPILFIQDTCNDGYAQN